MIIIKFSEKVLQIGINLASELAAIKIFTIGTTNLSPFCSEFLNIAITMSYLYLRFKSKQRD